MLHSESVNAALADLLVVDLTTVRSGPTGTKILDVLAAAGAIEVTK